MRLHIDRLGINGEGIGKSTDNENKDKLCFVSFALPNEDIEIEIIGDKKNYSTAKLKEILEKSEKRVTPKCKFFGVCGGCDIQHMDKSLQLEFKKIKVADTLKKISKLDIGVSDVIRLNDYSYRNKMVFPIIRKNNINIIGMFAPSSHDIVEIDSCLICNETINKVLNISKGFFRKSILHGFDFKTKKGQLKYLVVRSINEKTLVTIVTTKIIDLEDYYQCLAQNFDNIGLSLIVSDSFDDILSGKYFYIDGLKNLELVEHDLKYNIDNRGFLQVNYEVKEVLYNLVLNEIDNESEVIDAYSGAGLLSAIISNKAKFVTAIEINKSARNSAINLARENNINNIKFICGDVKNYMSSVAMHKQNLIIILDPPRSGCEKSVIDAIISLENNVKKIIYISCNPSTLARDLDYLKDKFVPYKIVPLDMFPQTKHVETIVCLKCVNNTKEV